LIFFYQKWQEENDKSREKLLSLIGKIGRDAKIPKTTNQVRQFIIKNVIISKPVVLVFC
jgi:hypothetical protein